MASKRSRKKSGVQEAVLVKGFLRVAVWDPGENGEPMGRIVSDSGYVANTITNIGYQTWLQYCLAGSAGSSPASYAALGTGTAPATNATTLPGELQWYSNERAALNISYNGSTQIQYTAAWASGLCSAQVTLQNAGLYAISNTSNASLYCGKSYTTQTWNTNQSVSLTYQLNLATA